MTPVPFACRLIALAAAACPLAITTAHAATRTEATLPEVTLTGAPTQVAQADAPAPAPAPADPTVPVRDGPMHLGRPGTTEKSFTLTGLEIVGFDLLLSNYNRAFSGSHDYDVSIHSIEHNLRGPWVTDNDPFKINQFAHPYQGSLYHAAGRSMGLSYWEASAMTFAGSAYWEIFGEKTPPSVNDQVASGIAGSFFGEPLFRMAHLVQDHSTLPAGWKPYATAFISPPVAINRRLFGQQGYGGTFDDHDPAYYSRLHLGVAHTTVDDVAASPATNFHANTAEVDYQMDYGLPGQKGYTYNRPFDFFQFQAVASSANGIENLTSNGLLWGDAYTEGDGTVHGVWGVFGTYEYLSPQIYHVSSTSLSLGTALAWNPVRDLAVQATVQGGVGYAAASSTVRDVDSQEYHYGTAPRAQASLRVIEANRLSLDVGARLVSLGSVADRAAGRDTISRVESTLTWRVMGHHAIGVGYIWSHRSATFGAAANERKQTLGQVGLFYTLLGQQDLGAVDTSR